MGIHPQRLDVMHEIPCLGGREGLRKRRHGSPADAHRDGLEEMPPVMAQLDAARHAGRQGEIRRPDRVAPGIDEERGRDAVSQPGIAMTNDASGAFELLFALREGCHRHRRFVRDDELGPRLFLFPPVRESLDELDDGQALLHGQFIPGRHRRPPQPVADRDVQVLVGGQISRAAGGRVKFENAGREIARFRIEKACGRTVAVTLLAVTTDTAAEIHRLASRIDVLEGLPAGRLERSTGGKPRGDEDFAPIIDRGAELLHIRNECVAIVVKFRRGRSDGVFVEPRETRHDGVRHHVARIPVMGRLPIVAVFSPDARQIGADSSGAEHVRLVVDIFAGLRNRPPAQILARHRPHELRMTVPAAFTDVDLPSAVLQRRVIGDPDDLPGGRGQHCGIVGLRQDRRQDALNDNRQEEERDAGDDEYSGRTTIPGHFFRSGTAFRHG